MNRFNIEDIIRFANKEMEETERKEFGAALQQDEQLKADYELYIKMDSALKVHAQRNNEDDVAFRDNLQKFNAEYFTEHVPVEKTRVRKLKVNRLFYAAAVFIIALFVWAPWNQNNYNEFFDAKMVSVEERGEGENLFLLKDAKDAFNKGNYDEAREKLKTLLETDTENDMLKFYYGISLMQTKDFNQSRVYLEQVYKGESVFKDESAYYIAFGFLKENNKEKAREWLEKIDEGSGIYRKSRQLLKEI